MTEEELNILKNGEMLSCNLTAKGSNYTFLSELNLNGKNLFVIYKPRKGEAPLWDFPSGTLYKRECASFVLDELLDWNIIPTTIIRDGTYGIGSVQLFVDHNPNNNYYQLNNSHTDELKKIACFDLIANNTDRKADHVIIDLDNKLWGIDQGLTFHSDIKIRTVIWDFQGEDIPQILLDDINQLKERLTNINGIHPFGDLLNELEQQALIDRLGLVMDLGQYPSL